MDVDLIPKKSRSMSACIGCGLLQDAEKWKSDKTCPNCGWRVDDDSGLSLDEWTSSSYNGVLALFQPQKSWCSSWLKYNKNVPGLYCIDNLGEVNNQIVQFLIEQDKPLPEWVERFKQSSSH